MIYMRDMTNGGSTYQVMKRPNRFGLVTAMAGALAACSVVPSAGPTSSEIERSAGNGETDGYLVRDLDDSVVKLLAQKRPSTFSTSFGRREAAPNQRIGVGDVVSVSIWEAAAGGLFSQSGSDKNSSGARSANIPEQVVGRDGAITVPYAGRIRVVGLSSPQVETAITQRLAGKAIEPSVLVTVTRNLSNTATVVGEVTNGARVPLSAKGDRVLDVIAAAGGIRSPAHESFVKLQRHGRTITMPMQVLISNASENIFVHPDDVITVVRDPQTFTAFGAASRNAVVPFDAAGITLEQAVAKAGGLIDNRSDPYGVFLMRYEDASLVRQLAPQWPLAAGETRVPVVYHVNLRDAKSYFLAQRFQVRNGDMLYVANAPLNELQKVLMIFTLAAQPVQTSNTLQAAF